MVVQNRVFIIFHVHTFSFLLEFLLSLLEVDFGELFKNLLVLLVTLHGQMIQIWIRYLSVLKTFRICLSKKKLFTLILLGIMIRIHM